MDDHMIGNMHRNSSPRNKLTIWIPSPVVRIFLLITVACTLAVGFGTSTLWIVKLIKPETLEYLLQNLPVLTLGFIITITLSLLNIGLRWVRWHFLIRHIGARLITKDSMFIYLVTLPAIMTPFYIGELFRTVLLRKKYSQHLFDVVAIWLLERSSDLLVLSFFLSVVRGGQFMFLIISGVIWLVIVAVLKTIYYQAKLSNFPQPLVICVLLSFSLVTCIFPGLSLWAVIWLLHNQLGIDQAFNIFTYSTIFGNILGIPSGVGVTGSSMIMMLQTHNISLFDATFGTFVLRMGTIWFTVALGVLAFIVYRHRLQALINLGQASNHFDEISDDYNKQIPSCVRDRLLTRKVNIMQRKLEGSGLSRGCYGIDVGCGQGWYACEMTRRGYKMCAVDQSKEQIKRAYRYAKEQHIKVSFEIATASALPFPSNYFDFAYAINVIHHMTNEETRRLVLQEIIRVLKPGGIFFMHEMNTTNILFRFYMSYLFPLIRTIDEGTEKWISPYSLPAVHGARWIKDIDYFTFLPDFSTPFLMRLLKRLELSLEQSVFYTWSAHYMARLVKET